MQRNSRNPLTALAAMTFLLPALLPAQVWITGHGDSSSEYHIADTNGDGYSDAVVIEGSFIYVARSNGYYFEPRQGAGLANAPGETHFGDVNGDGREDLIRFQSSTGNWQVELATASGIYNVLPTLWLQTHGIGSQRRFLRDVDGDGRADAIVYFAGSGSWYVAKSTGTGFSTPSLWISGHGVGSNNQFVGDCDGDGRDDAVVYFGGAGDWWAALSNGNQFNTPSQWDTDHGIGSQQQFLADISGDGKADAIIVLSGDWYVARSNIAGTAFSPWSPYEFAFGGGIIAAVGNVGYGPPVDGLALDISSGTWYVRPSSGGGLVRYSSAVPFGSGCPGSNGTPMLARSTGPNTAAVPGGTLTTVLSNVPSLPWIGIAGFSNTSNNGLPLPASLGIVGAPGCTAYVSLDVLESNIGPNWQIPMPNSSAILDTIFYLQAAQIDIGINALNTTVSNALRVQVGEI